MIRARSAFRPEIAERIHPDHRHTLLLQGVADLPVDIAPATSARIDHSHGVARGLRVEDRERQTEWVVGFVALLDIPREHSGQGGIGVVLRVRGFDVRVLCDERCDMLAPFGRRCWRERDVDRVRRGSIGQAIDPCGRLAPPLGRHAELLGQGNALFGIDCQGLADRRGGRLGCDRQRHGAAGADSGDNRRPISTATGGALNLLTQGFDIRDGPWRARSGRP